MSVLEKENRILPLFKKLTSLTRQKLPVEERDPRLANAGVLPRGTLFSCFHEKHLQEATELFEIIFLAKDFEDFVMLATQARDIVNEGLYVYVLSIVVVHRDDCRGVTLPPIQEVFPDRFIPSETINMATKEAKNHPDRDIEVEIQQTGNILGPEYKLAYFREDVGINAHHWNWHVVYPANWNEELTGKIKDRKSELLYYSHQQMCARYDCERLCNDLNRTIPFHNFEEKLEGYAPHLTSLVSGLHYASRPNGLRLHDLPDVNIQDMERWRERILEAIHLKHIHADDGSEIPLDKANGANILGTLIEASSSTPNRAFYGSLVYWGQVMIARMQDPDGRFHENPGVMSDSSTCLRDPMFYRWHRFVDKIFQQYKATLHAYTNEELSFEGIKILSAQVKAKQRVNVVFTYINEDRLDLSHGIDFGISQKVFVKYHHMDHEPFSIIINIENNAGSTKHATIRIFLGPKNDELGNPLAPDHQRRLMIELDKFYKELAPGKNAITRDAAESNVTLSHSYTFEELTAGRSGSEDASKYCICGWPQHMLLPRGTIKGMEFDLFVMATDYTKDNPTVNVKTICSDASSYCGAKDQKYPDLKPMGFPFDRPIKAASAAELLTGNMSMTGVIIKHLC